MNYANRNSFGYNNLPEIIWFLDPDEVVRFYAAMLDAERQQQTNDIVSLLDLFDPDLCPERYLSHLAAVIGCPYYMEDQLSTRRAQIRSAIQRYKEKGKPSSFELIFRSMGFDVVIHELWMDKAGEVRRIGQLTAEQLASGDWVPHARIDVEIIEREGYPAGQEITTIRPGVIQKLLARMEEVRPIHVLLRMIFLGKSWTESVSMSDEWALGLLVEDRYIRMGGSPCALTWCSFRPDMLYNGIMSHHFGWEWRFNTGYEAGHRPSQYCFDNPYAAPFTFGPYLYGDDWHAIGDIITFGEGYMLHFDGAAVPQETGNLPLTFEGGADAVTGTHYLYDGAVYNPKYFYDCPFGWSTDLLLIALAMATTDRFGRVLSYDGSVDFDADPFEGPFFDITVIDVADDGSVWYGGQEFNAPDPFPMDGVSDSLALSVTGSITTIDFGPSTAESGSQEGHGTPEGPPEVIPTVKDGGLEINPDMGRPR